MEDMVNPKPSDWLFVNLDISHIYEYQNIKMLCKTKQAYNALKTIIPLDRLKYTGFTSIDRKDDRFIQDFRKFIHVAGKSPFKGTKEVVKAWLNNPSWPSLTVICRSNISKAVNKLLKGNNPSNIIVNNKFLTEDELAELINTNGIHICTSESEGFGHYANEARSIGAVTLFTNAPPLNEYFQDSITGIGVDCVYNGLRPNGLCKKYKCDMYNIEKAVERTLSMSISSLKTIGANARELYLQDKETFTKNLTNLINGDERIPDIIHQIFISKDNPYKNIEYPEKYKEYRTSWKDNNTSFEMKFWSGQDILELIQSKFPQYLEFYKNLNPMICKCDFARFAIISVYGGLYVDIDFMCRKSIKPLLTGSSYFIFGTPEIISISIINGIFAAIPNHPFVNGWLKQMSKNKGGVMKKTGPIGLNRFYNTYTGDILFGKTCGVVSIIDTNEISKMCRGSYDTYTGTLWNESSWGNDIVDKSTVQIYKTTNYIDNSSMRWEKDTFTEDKLLALEIFEDLPDNDVIIDEGANFSITLGKALLNIGKKDITIYAISESQEKCDFIEKMAVINTLPNVKVIHEPK